MLWIEYSNLFKILCLSSLSASLKKIQSKLKVPSCPHIFGTQWQVTPKSMDICGRNSNLSEILWISCKFDDDTIKKMKVLLSPQHFLQYKSMRNSFGAQGQVTPKPIVRSGPKSNMSEVLCLSSLSASLKNIWSKLKTLLCPQHFFWRSRADYSKEMDGCGQNSNLSETLWLSCLPASLMTIW